jgi:hypothetical protein
MGDTSPLGDRARASELVPLRKTDLLVVAVRDEMIVGRWNAERRDQMAIERGVSRSAIEHAAEEAGRFLRIQRAPGLLVETALAELRTIAESQAEEAPAVAVAAWRTILDAIGKLVDRVSEKGDGGQDATLEEMLKPGQTPPELAALLTRCWGERTVW